MLRLDQKDPPMPRRRLLVLVSLGLCVTAAGQGAAAAQLALDCQVQASRPDNGVTHWRRRIVLTSADHMARFWDDVGGGFRPRSAHPFVSVSRDRIVLDASAGKQSFIDRRTGAYRLRNASAHFQLEGRCTPATPAPSPAEGRRF